MRPPKRSASARRASSARSPRATMVFMRVLRKSSYFSRFQVRSAGIMNRAR